MVSFSIGGARGQETPKTILANILAGPARDGLLLHLVSNVITFISVVMLFSYDLSCNV